MNTCRPSLSSLALLGVMALAACTSTPRTPITPRLNADTWISQDGKAMPWREWRVPAGVKEKAVVITVHGLSGAASDFWLLGERLPPQGIAVYGYELRGQGNDPDKARRGDIRSADLWLRDLLTFHRLVRERHPHTRILWYGESLGSLIALHAAVRERRDGPDALVLASPVAGLKQPINAVERCLIIAASHTLPIARVKLGDLAGVDENKMRVTAGSTHGEQMARTPHHVATFTLRTLREIGSLLDKNEQAARHTQIPVLMLASPHDIVASPAQVQKLYDQLSTTDKQLHWYDRSYHLLLHDVQHEEVLRDLIPWLKQRAK